MCHTQLTKTLVLGHKTKIIHQCILPMKSNSIIITIFRNPTSFWLKTSILLSHHTWKYKLHCNLNPEYYDLISSDMDIQCHSHLKPEHDYLISFCNMAFPRLLQHHTPSLYNPMTALARSNWNKTTKYGMVLGQWLGHTHAFLSKPAYAFLMLLGSVGGYWVNSSCRVFIISTNVGRFFGSACQHLHNNCFILLVTWVGSSGLAPSRTSSYLLCGRSPKGIFPLRSS